MSGQGRPGATAVAAAGLSVAIAATRWHPEITEMKRNGGKNSPRRKRRLYSSTDRMPLMPRL